LVTNKIAPTRSVDPESQKAACDRTSAHNYAIRKGEAKGTLKIARKMKKMEMPVSQIAEATGLPPETIKRL
jgi:predicted transposase/invertase (TIGR01784 family)